MDGRCALDGLVSGEFCSLGGGGDLAWGSVAGSIAQNAANATTNHVAIKNRGSIIFGEKPENRNLRCANMR